EELSVAKLFRELLRPFGRSQSRVRVCQPERRSSSAEQGLHLLPTIQARQDLVELRGACPEVRQIDEGQGPKEPDLNASLLVEVADQFDGLGVEVERLLLRPPFPALFGGRQE